MENETGFLSNLQTAYTDAFLNSNSNVLTPEVITVVILVSVVLGVFYEKVLEPGWVKRQVMKTNQFPEQKQFVWFRLGAGACIFMGTALVMLLMHWPR